MYCALCFSQQLYEFIVIFCKYMNKQEEQTKAYYVVRDKIKYADMRNELLHNFKLLTYLWCNLKLQCYKLKYFIIMCTVYTVLNNSLNKSKLSICYKNETCIANLYFLHWCLFKCTSTVKHNTKKINPFSLTFRNFSRVNGKISHHLSSIHLWDLTRLTNAMIRQLFFPCDKRI